MHLRFLVIAFSCAASVGLLTGCGTAVSTNWRSEAQQCLAGALSAGAGAVAPEETENIRDTLYLADRFQRSDQIEDSDRLYLLSNQKCQLLLRSLSAPSPDKNEIPVGELPSRKIETLQMAEDTDNSHAPLHADEYAASADILLKGAGHDQADITKRRKFSKSKTHGGFAKNQSVSSEQLSRAQSRDQVFRIKPSEVTIYLTFDDGPSHLTLPIAAYLQSEGIPATFFVLGSNIKGREKSITRTLAMGHRVGNHTYSHNLKKLKASLTGDYNEIKRTGTLVERLGGDGRMVRIPYGATNASIQAQIAVEGAQAYEWDINSKDSTLRGVKDHLLIENTVLRQLNRTPKKHVVVLFHDGAGHDSTLTALRDLIPRLKQDGYRFGLLTRSEKVARLPENGKVVQ